jgi:DNA-binding beta-propeller fold protein YncE
MAVEGAAPAEVAGYRIEQRIGRGGMGEVYRAVDVRLGRPVALKLLRLELNADSRFRERLLRESRLAAALDHPNVIPIYEAGEADGRLFIAMRFVDGADLRTLLRRAGRIDPGRAVAIAAQVADALDAAHERGLVHRDVKASNVLVDRPGGREHCYLADFGLTQSASDSGPADGQFMGTVDYVAPEQIRGDDVDGRADQYALGCLLFELLTGTLPFMPDSEVATVFAHLQEPPPHASVRNLRLPAAVDAVLKRALAKDPRDRFEGCRALVDATGVALGLAAPERGPTRQLRGWPVAAAGMAVVAAAVAVSVALITRGGDVSPPRGSLLRIDPVANRVTATAAIAGAPAAVAVAGSNVWVADVRTQALWRFNPRTDTFTRVVSSGEPRSLAALAGKMYVASDGPNAFSGTVVRYDAATGQREGGVDVQACTIASGEGVVWVAGCPFLVRLSTDDGPLRRVRRVFIPYRTPLSAENDRVQFRALAVGGDSLWVLGDALDRRLWQLDLRSGTIRSITALGFPPRSLTYAAGLIWITDPLDDRVVALDVRTHAVRARINVCRGASGIAAAAGFVWVACSLDGAVARIGTGSLHVLQTLHVQGKPTEVAAGNGAVWVTTDAR